MIAELRIHSKSGNVDPRRGADSLTLNAEDGWVVDGPKELIASVVRALPNAVVTELTPTTLLLEFGNDVGHYDAGPLGKLIVMSGKWGVSDYDALLERISEEASALPFAAGAPSALPFERSITVDHALLYHAFIYLRQITAVDASRERALLPALQSVLNDPHRRFVREGRVVPIECARNIDARVVSAIAAARFPLHRAPVTAGPLAVALHGHLPEQIEESAAVMSFDTPENRFVKAFLDTALLIVRRMRDQARSMRRKRLLAARLLHDCEAIERKLAPLRARSLWREVGTMNFVPSGSSVIAGRSAYRTVFLHDTKLRLGSRWPVDDEASQALLEAKNIALLYEVWSFFAMIRAVNEVVGEAPVAAERVTIDDMQASVRWGFRVTWRDGTALAYNASFSRRAEERRAYSVGLRPDLALTVPPGRTNAGLHIFDAKFKVQWRETELEALPSEEVQGQAVEEELDAETQQHVRDGAFLRGDLYKMHAYRDAIAGARSAWILYPGTRVTFYHEEGTVMNALHLAPLDGVGAVALGTTSWAELTRVAGVLLGKRRA